MNLRLPNWYEIFTMVKLMEERHPQFLSTPIAILLGSLFISISILISSGALTLKGGLGMRNPSPIPQAQDAAVAPQASPDTGPVKVTLDDDAVLGDKNAKLTMVEFSDYECPFCKRYFDDTYTTLKKDYVDTGKLKIVFRDLPLSFHQNAHKEAEAADCVRDQGGDTAYWKYHDIIYTRTTSNGTGFALDKLPGVAEELGLNVSAFQQCLDSNKFVSEVDKDLADATKFGADGTPTFFIGKSTSDGTIEGTKLVGAQPTSAFKTILDQQLSE